MNWDNSNTSETYPPEYYSAFEAANSIRKLAKLESTMNIGGLLLLWVADVVIAGFFLEAFELTSLNSIVEAYKMTSQTGDVINNPMIFIFNCLPFVFAVLVLGTLFTIWVNLSKGGFAFTQSLSTSGLIQQMAEKQLDTSEITSNTPSFLRHLARTPQPDIKSQLQHVAHHVDWYLAAPAPYYPNGVPFLLLTILLLIGILFPGIRNFLPVFGFQIYIVTSVCLSTKSATNKALFADYITANLDLFKAQPTPTS